jgi:Uma2 family endonuclease
LDALVAAAPVVIGCGEGMAIDTMLTTMLTPIPRWLEPRDDDKPYVEIVHGRRERKVRPKRTHGLLQGRLSRWLDDWAAGRGEVMTELRCFFLRADGSPSSLVPDVAYMSYARMPRDLAEDARERPRIAPDIAVEVWSPGDRRRTIEEKIELYLGNGAVLVMLVFPKARTIEFHQKGHDPLIVPASGIVTCPGFDDLTLDADWLFANV